MYITHHAHTQHNIIYNSLQNIGRNPLDLGKTSQQYPGPSFWKGLPRVINTSITHFPLVSRSNTVKNDDGLAEDV